MELLGSPRVASFHTLSRALPSQPVVNLRLQGEHHRTLGRDDPVNRKLITPFPALDRLTARAYISGDLLPGSQQLYVHYIRHKLLVL